MKSVQTLIRRTAVGLSAIAALIVTGYAVSQSVELRDSNGVVTAQCSYSEMKVTPNGGVIVSCSSSSATGSFTVSAPNSLPVNTTTTNQVNIVRTGTTPDAAVNWQVSGTGCATDSGTINFTAGTGSSKPIAFTTGNTFAPGTTCVVGITPPAGMGGSPTSKTISIVNPDADVSFAFSSPSSTASVGTTADQIVVTRSGGTNGVFQVPVAIAGTLAPSGTLLAGTLSPSTLTFNANSASATVTYTPPSTTPSSPGLPANLLLSLGTPVQTSGPSGQAGTIGSNGTHEVTLNGPAVGCPSPEASVGSLGSGGTVNVLRGSSVLTATYALPNTGTGFANIGLYQTPYTPVSGQLISEIHISKCRGMTANQNNGCYTSSNSLSQVVKIWQTKLTSKLASPAAIAAIGRCYAPASQGPWYINIRVTYDTCSSMWGTCGWQPIWKEQIS